MTELLSRSLKQQKRLSAEEANELFARRDTDKAARDELIERNIRLVPYAIKGLRYRSEDEDDVISIGIIALIRAVDTFDVNNSASFVTYACTCIKHAVMNKYFNKLPDVRPDSIDAVVYEAADGDEVTVGDTIPSDSNTFESAMKFIDVRKLDEIMKKSLTERRYYILCSLYGLFGFEQKSAFRLSKELHITQQAVSYTKTMALNKLRGVMVRDGWHIS